MLQNYFFDRFYNQKKKSFFCRFVSLFNDVKWSFWEIHQKSKFFVTSFSPNRNHLLIFHFGRLLNDVKASNHFFFSFGKCCKIIFLTDYITKKKKSFFCRFVSLFNDVKWRFWEIHQKSKIFVTSFSSNWNHLLIFHFGRLLNDVKASNHFFFSFWKMLQNYCFDRFFNQKKNLFSVDLSVCLMM